ncbi:hypothetical protein BGZ75_009375 [Mortierella antarctica]|nr:hypothetical protein BGZ75_009375 [Mortierella antarctica]
MTRDLINMLYHHALVECSQTLNVLRPALHVLVKSLPAAASIVLLCYMAAVRRCRFRGIKTLLDKYPDPTTPLRDINVAHEVYSRTLLLDFPFMAGISLEMTGLKTFAIPSISKVLVATKQMTTDCKKRLEDTALILTELHEVHPRRVARSMLEEAIDPKTGATVERVRATPLHIDQADVEEEQERRNDDARAEAALKRLNFLHSHYRISQDDYTYNLSLFVLEATRWIDRFEWRKLTDLEKNAILAVWTQTGRAMGIKNIPGSVQEYAEWAETYESKKMVFAPSNAVVAESSMAFVESIAPPAASLLRDFIVSLMTPRLRAAFGYQAPVRYKVWMFNSLLWLRGCFVKHLMLPRTVPLVRTALRAAKEGKGAEGQKTESVSGCPFSGHKRYITRFDPAPPPVYPQGYAIEELGPDKFSGKGPAGVNANPSAL